MATLRDLLPLSAAGLASAHKQLQLAVYNTNIAAVTNGGQSCAWTVPVNTTWATFEVWSGGGDGAGACCCAGPYCGPGAGQYAKKTLNVTAGCFFCVCAAGSGCCSQANPGTCGFPSFVLCGTGGTSVLCSSGGNPGNAVCGHMGGLSCTGICVGSCVMSCNSSGYDLAFPSVMGAEHENNFCVGQTFMWLQGAPKYQNNSRHSGDGCTVNMARQGCDQMYGQAALWPSHGGATAHACGGGCCWGQWGAGGLVMVTYG